jgi:hypothetical protein
MSRGDAIAGMNPHPVFDWFPLAVKKRIALRRTATSERRARAMNGARKHVQIEP